MGVQSEEQEEEEEEEAARHLPASRASRRFVRELPDAYLAARVLFFTDLSVFFILSVCACLCRGASRNAVRVLTSRSRHHGDVFSGFLSRGLSPGGGPVDVTWRSRVFALLVARSRETHPTPLHQC